MDSYASDNLEIAARCLCSPVAGLVTSAGDRFTTPIPLMVQQYSNSSFGSHRSSVAPLSPVQNQLEKMLGRSSSMFPKPLKAEEDVLVMDGIMVGSVPGGRMRSVSHSGSGSSSGNSNYKTDVCQSWEDSGSCHYGSKCTFAHGKEELRPTGFSFAPTKNKSEVICKYATAGSCTYGTKCRYIHPVMTQGAAQTVPSLITVTSKDWSPLDDGIELILLSSSSSSEETSAMDDVDAYLLYGPRRRNRLPIFAKICPQ